MADTQHTPGPWDAETTNRLAYYAVHHWVNGEKMCLPHSEANAALIAAAPDLLEVVFGLLDAHDNGTYSDDELERLYEGAATAIAKSRGE